MTEMCIKKLFAIQKKMAKVAYGHTCQFLKISDNKIVCGYGSGVLVKHNNNYFIFTAAHVIDDEAKNEIYIAKPNTNQVFKPGGNWHYNIPATERKEDKIDSAILELDAKSVSILKDAKYNFLDSSLISEPFDESPNQPYFVAIGFPASKTKYNPKINQVKSSPFLYVTSLHNSEMCSKENCNNSVNLILKRNRKVKDTQYENLNKIPDLHGMSGGGVWYINPMDKKMVLAGIMTECTNNSIICTKIVIFEKMIKSIQTKA